ncbi:hypothetical protein [Roseovarius sp. ZX-A-9]|uniref:hypothetical protein n=1 Tax=Roseovarius sp. ZX-A-9 TaxID=3014783 RepID=UPI00232FAEF1|nr:hypothetical protein [Roseovarius sp. ZX-A-9]
MELTWQTAWYESKAWIQRDLGMSGDTLHVHFGLALFLACAFLLRKRRYGMLLAWGVVAVLQALNEILDARDWIIWTGSVNWLETAKDFGTTLFWPTVLLLAWRWVGDRENANRSQTTLREPPA